MIAEAGVRTYPRRTRRGGVGFPSPGRSGMKNDQAGSRLGDDAASVTGPGLVRALHTDPSRPSTCRTCRWQPRGFQRGGSRDGGRAGFASAEVAEAGVKSVPDLAGSPLDLQARSAQSAAGVAQQPCRRQPSASPCRRRDLTIQPTLGRGNPPMTERRATARQPVNRIICRRIPNFKSKRQPTWNRVFVVRAHPVVNTMPGRRPRCQARRVALPPVDITGGSPGARCGRSHRTSC